jgi:hypothetical protein
MDSEKPNMVIGCFGGVLPLVAMASGIFFNSEICDLLMIGSPHGFNWVYIPAFLLIVPFVLVMTVLTSVSYIKFLPIILAVIVVGMIGYRINYVKKEKASCNNLHYIEIDGLNLEYHIITPELFNWKARNGQLNSNYLIQGKYELRKKGEIFINGKKLDYYFKKGINLNIANNSNIKVYFTAKTHWTNTVSYTAGPSRRPKIIRTSSVDVVFIHLESYNDELQFAAQNPEADFATEPDGDGVVITKYKGNGGDVVIPPAIGGKPVRGIGTEAFYYCESLSTVTIPGSVTTIGEYAFWGCASLTAVTIPDSVTAIGAGAFGDCKSLTSVTIPDSVTSVGDDAFSRCDKLKPEVRAEIERRFGWGFFE